jgi:CubicO group peptidase (beta-lactamase class C family)
MDRTDSVPAGPAREIQGMARPPFEPLVDVFARVAGAEPGNLALTMFRDGQCVVNLATVGYSTHSRQILFSVSKAVVAIALTKAAEDGLVDLDAPISAVWPAMSKASTRQITVRHILSHRSGLAAITQPVSMQDLLDGRVEAMLEQQEPLWEPGTAVGYHAVTFGWLLDGYVRRATSTDLRTLVSSKVATPLGLDLTLGLNPGAEASLTPQRLAGRKQIAARRGISAPETIQCAAVAALMADLSIWNSPEVLGQAWGSSNVIASASDLAQLLSATLGPHDGTSFLKEESARMLATQQSGGLDRLLGIQTRYGSGVQLAFPQLPFIGPSCYGHEGANGCMAFADPETGLSVAFTTDTFPLLDGASPAATVLLAAVRHSIETESA